MKKFILFLAFVSLTFGASTTKVGGSGKSKVGGSGKTKVNASAVNPNLLFEWHGESTTVTSGTPVGYSAGDATATLHGSAAISNTQFQDGSNSISVPSTNSYYDFTWASSDIVNPSAGTIDFYVYWVSLAAGTGLIKMNVDSSNVVYVRWDTGGYVFLQHTAGGTATSTRTLTSILTTGTWYHIKARWDTTAHSGIYSKITCDTTTGESNSNADGTSALGTFSGTSGTLSFGDVDGFGDNLFIDNIKIYNNWQ